MDLQQFIDAVLLTIGHSTEDMTQSELNTLKDKIILAANMGMDAIARETYPLEKSVDIIGVQELRLGEMDGYIKLLCYCGGKAERYVDESGCEVLSLLEPVEYRITYTALPKFIENRNDDYTFEFPLQVLQALIYYCCYHILSPVNDKREYAYFTNLYNQQCANIIANLPRRCRIVGGKHGI